MKSTPFRYVAIAPGRIDERKTIGPASYLHDFLVDHQTDAEGNVNYGKAISYAWILARWEKAPAVRTLHRHMARLKAAGRVWVRQLPFRQGMRIRVLGSAKWAPKARQIPLFPAAEPLSISSGKAVENLLKLGKTAGPKVALLRGQKWPRNALRT